MRTVLIAVPLMDRVEDVLVPIAMDRLRTSPPLGVYWLAGMVRSAGYPCEVLDLIATGWLDEALIRKSVDGAGLVGVSCNSLNWPTGLVVMRLIRQAFPTLPIVLGGIHPSTYPEHVLKTSPADYVICGEGERPLVALIEALRGRRPLSEVPGLCFLDGAGGLRSVPNDAPLAPAELAALPDPAYDLLPRGVYEALSVESARGCRFRCTFCSTKNRGSWRGISAQQFVDRLRRMEPFLERTIHRVFSFVDDLYTLKHDRLREVTELLEAAGMEVRATLDARATDIVRDGVIESLMPITNHMLIGAECGYDEGLRKIRKGCNVAIIERAAERLHDAGLAPNSVFSFVIGFPFESFEDCLKTVEFASLLLVRYNVRIYLQWFNTIPGSPIWDELQAAGRVDIGMYDQFGFFQNERLFRAGVRLTDDQIVALSDIIQHINTLLLITQPANDILQFNRPEWLWHQASLGYPSGPTVPNRAPSYDR